MAVRIVEVPHEHAVVNAGLAPDRPREQLHGGHRVGMIGGIEAIADSAEYGLAAPARVDGIVLAPVAFVRERLPRIPQKIQSRHAPITRWPSRCGPRTIPFASTGFLGVVVDTTNLEGSIWTWWREGGKFHIDKTATIPPEPAPKD